MGYDCYVRGAEMRAMPDLNDREALGDYFEWQDQSGTYFRRNISGMGPTRDALEAMDMGFWAERWVEMPPFPSIEAYGATWDRDFDDDGEPVTDAGKRHREALSEHLRWHGPEVPGIPLHKLCSNDGWHVTKEECQAALLIYRKAIESGKPRPEYFGDDLIPFLETAARHGGFEVF